MNKRIKANFLIYIAVFVLLGSTFIFADGDTRPATPAEKELNKTVLTAFTKAIPPGPEGWEKTGSSTEIKEIQYVPDIKNLPLRIEFYAVWQDTQRIKDANIKFQEELIKLSQKPGFTGEGVDELQKKMTPHDVEVRINITANLTSQGIYEKVAPASPIAGGMIYYSQAGYRNGWKEGTTYVFFGNNWKMTSSSSSGTYIDFKPDKPMTSAAVVRNIAVKVQADPARSQRIIKQIDWEALKGMIKN